MKPIEDLLKAWEMHYSTNERELRYTPVQRNEMVRKYAWIGQGFAGVLYDTVVSQHPMSLRSLPDMAVITDAMKGLDRPEVYAASTDALQIEDKTEEVYSKVEEAMKRLDHLGTESNHEQREHRRNKVRKGDATAAERYWVRVIDEFGGDWAAAHRAIGEEA